MSDSDLAGQVHHPSSTSPSTASPATASTASPAPVASLSDPTAVLVLDAVTGRVISCNPAGRRRLAGVSGSQLAYRLSDLATAAGHRDGATARTWTDTAPLRAVSAPVRYRSRDCLLVVLRDDAGTPARPDAVAPGGVPVADDAWAAFTLDQLGRIDGWGITPQRLFGHGAEHVIGADTTLLLTPPARLAGDHHRCLTQAYRAGEHRTEGWRLCADGRLLWAEVTTAPLYDETDRLLGFAQVLRDLTPLHRLQQRPGVSVPDGAPALVRRGLPAPRTGDALLPPAAFPPAVVLPPAAALPPAPGAATVAGMRRPSRRIPTQRRP